MKTKLSLRKVIPPSPSNALFQCLCLGANQHQAEDRFEDFYTFFVRAYKKRNGAADFISKASIAKEIRRHATDYRFTDSEISAYFKRLNDGGIIMFVDGYEDQFMVI